MFANRSGLQKSTLRNILIASVLTLPVYFFLGATIFAGLVYLFFNVWGWNNLLFEVVDDSEKTFKSKNLLSQAP